jgi:hypothetical protein
MIVAIVWLAQAYGSKNRSDYQATVRTAIERGVPLTPETLKALGAPQRTRFADIRLGLIWVAVALACAVFGWAVNDASEGEAMRVFLGFAAFPGFIGIALLGFGIATLLDKKNGEQ